MLSLWPWVRRDESRDLGVGRDGARTKGSGETEPAALRSGERSPRPWGHPGKSAWALTFLLWVSLISIPDTWVQSSALLLELSSENPFQYPQESYCIFHPILIITQGRCPIVTQLSCVFEKKKNVLLHPIPILKNQQSKEWKRSHAVIWYFNF